MLVHIKKNIIILFIHLFIYLQTYCKVVPKYF